MSEQVPSRRLFLAAASAGAVFAGMKAADAMAGPSQQDDLALGLWEQRHALREPTLAAYKVQNEAEARTAWWALPGPEFLAHDGTHIGRGVGWPAIRDMVPSPREGSLRLMRPGKLNLRKDYDLHISMGGGRWALQRYRGRLRELALRRRQQKEETQRSGLTAAQAACQSLYERACVIENQIRDRLTPTSPNATAALVLLQAMGYEGPRESIDNHSEFDVAAIAFRHLRPSLRGILAVHVDEILEHPERRLGDCQAYLGDYDYGKVTS